jgi:hypothetical protein
VSSNAQLFPPRSEVQSRITAPIPRSITMACLAMAALGAAVFVIGLFADPTRVWRSLHFNWLFFTVMSSAAVVFVAVMRLATARWSRPVARFLEGYVAFLPIAFVLLLLILLFGSNHVFTWTHEAPPAASKAAYLAPGFFYTRVILIFGIICALSVWYIWTTLKLDVGVTSEDQLPHANGGWAAGIRARMRESFGSDERRALHSVHSIQGKIAVMLCIAFGMGWVVLSWDLAMTLSLHFQSTMYGWQFFMGGWLAMLMTWGMLTMWWQSHLKVNDLVTKVHFHDIGKLAFAFTAFWGYLTFSQYLIIWFGNWYEETHYYRLRLMPPYTWITVSVFAMAFIVPFFGLMGKAPKLHKPTFTVIATICTVGIWLHRYIEVYPSTFGEVTTLPFGLWEIGVTVGMIGLWGFSYVKFMDAFPRMRVLLMTSPYRDEVQVPVDPRTMEPLPAHE